MQDDLSGVDRKLLSRFAFDEERFRRIQRAIRDGSLGESSSVLTGALSPPSPGDVAPWPRAGSERARQLKDIGEETLKKGEVAVVVVAGGMATRFGGVVKANVEVEGGRSFLQIKLEDVRSVGQRYGRTIPFGIMTSFATHDGIEAHLKEKGLIGPEVELFPQRISLRLSPSGALLREKDGTPSYYAPGHGDFFWAIRRSGTLAKWLRKGIKTLFFSNVDNLGATLDPVVVGFHVQEGTDLTAELANRSEAGLTNARSAAVVGRVDGRLRLVEGLRLPVDFDPSRYGYVSTNNLLFRASALDRDVPLVSHVVQKKIDGRAALQVETITCEATELTDPASGKPMFSFRALQIPSDRFFPVKEPQDLDRLREWLKGRSKKA